MMAAIRSWLRRHADFVRQATPVVIALAATAVSLAIVAVPMVRSIDEFVRDVAVTDLAPPEPQESGIVIAAITDDTLDSFPYRTPIDRGFLADVVAKLALDHPRAIGVDVLFDQPTEPDKDARLRAVLASTHVPLVVSYSDDPNTVTDTQLGYMNAFVPERLRGYATTPTDKLDVVRQIFPGAKSKDGRYIPGFARAIAMKLGAKTPAGYVPVVWHAAQDIHTPAFAQYPAQLVKILPASWFAGKVVLIGADATLLDRHRTPFDVVNSIGQETARLVARPKAGETITTGDRGEETPGVVIQAHMLSQLLHDRKPPDVGFVVDLLIAFAMAAVGAMLGAVNLPLFARISAGLGAAIVLWAAAAALMYYAGMLIGVVTPTLAMALSLWASESLTGREARQQRAFIHGTFARYVSPKVVEQLIREPERAGLGGERRVMTFLFSDIQNFTTMSEAIPPGELATIMNNYLDGMTQQVLKHDGMIDKFIGDAVFAIFNAPNDLSNHAECAVRCALDMDRFSYQFHLEQKARGIPFGITRIGVHTGPAVVGNFGSSSRVNYTAQGDSVNVASRLEGLNKHFHTRIAVSDATRRLCTGIPFRPTAQVVLKGKTEPIDVWEPLAEGDPRLDFMSRYINAYAALRDGDERAKDMLDRLAFEAPEDPCVALHLDRISRGEHGVAIVMTEK